jgi:Tfp pilus assembly protein PilN
VIPDINLLPAKERNRDKLYIILLMILIVWIIFLAVIFLQYYLTKSTNEALQARVASLEMEKTTLESQLQNQAPGLATDDYIGSISYVEQLTFSTSKIIKELKHWLPEYSYLTNYQYNVGQVTIQTQFDSLDRIAQYVKSLNQSELFFDVKVDHISTFRIEERETDTVDDPIVNVEFDEMPRYDVSFSLVINMAAILQDTGGEEVDE